MYLNDTAERIALCVRDADDTIQSAYHYTKESIDQITRPCWLVFPEDVSPDYGDSNSDGQLFVTTSYSLAYIGQPYNGRGFSASISQYERSARACVQNTLEYFLRNKMLQCENRRVLLPNKLPALDFTFEVMIDTISPVTLYAREGVSAESFWGFTVSMTVKQQVSYEENP